MSSFNDFVHENNLKNKAKSKINILDSFYFIGLNYVVIYLRNGPFSSDVGIVNLHHSKRNHWVTYINEKFFDS